MKRLLIALLFCAGSASAQETIAPRIAVMDDYVRAILIKDWDLHAKDSVVLERGYCLGWQLDFWGGEIVWRVTEISAPDSVDAGLNGINFSCRGKYLGHLSELHVHPATSCLSQDGPCFPGGVYAYQCLPSPPDERIPAGSWAAVCDDPMLARGGHFPPSEAPRGVGAVAEYEKWQYC